jgi:hypothetical protein
MGPQPILECIWADDTPLGDADMTHFSKLTALETLSLMRTRVTDAGVAELAKLPKLQTCHLGDGNDVARQIARISETRLFPRPMPAFRAPFGLREFAD